MTTDSGGSLPRWAGITEPMTVFTNIVLACVAFILGVRVTYSAAAGGIASAGAIGFGLVSTAFAAAVGAAAHGLDPVVDRVQRARCWSGALYIIGLVGASSVASVAYFAASGRVRTTILLVAGLKLLVYLVSIARRPEFRIAAVDAGGGLAVLFAGSVYAYVRWQVPAAAWLIGGVLVSAVSAAIQGRRVKLHRHFNHNDLFHVVQIVALYLFYRGGALLVDR
jgi:hypothetical protein